MLLIRHGDADGVRGFLRAVDRAYGRVPTAGELVMLDEGGDVGYPVDQVSWDNDGKAVLQFTNPAMSDDWLVAAGFELVYRG